LSFIFVKIAIQNIYNMLETIKEIIRNAAAGIREVVNLDSVSKGEIGNILTIADKKSEEIIINGLNAKFPDCRILSEEIASEITKDNFKSFKLLFLVDPIDGTTNYASGIPQAAISIGAYEFGEPKCEVVYDIFNKDLYESEVGKGLFLNGNKIQKRPTPILKEAVVGSSWAYGETPRMLIKKWEQLIGKVATLRVMGSAVLDLVMTATGQFTCSVHNSLNPWDSGASLIMLKEMGVVVTNWKKEEFTIFDEEIIAAPKEIFNEFYNICFKEK